RGGNESSAGAVEFDEGADGQLGPGDPDDDGQDLPYDVVVERGGPGERGGDVAPCRHDVREWPADGDDEEHRHAEEHEAEGEAGEDAADDATGGGHHAPSVVTPRATRAEPVAVTFRCDMPMRDR